MTLLETTYEEAVTIFGALTIFAIIAHWATPFYLIVRKRKQLERYQKTPPPDFTPAFTCTYLLSTFQVNLVSHGTPLIRFNLGLTLCRVFLASTLDCPPKGSQRSHFPFG